MDEYDVYITLARHVDKMRKVTQFDYRCRRQRCECCQLFRRQSLEGAERYLKFREIVGRLSN